MYSRFTKASYFLALAFYFTQVGMAQTSVRLEKGRDILSLARKAIYKGIKQSDVKGFQVEKEITLAVGRRKQSKVKSEDMQRVSMEKRVLASFPLKLKIIGKSFLPPIEGANNFLKSEITANGDDVRANFFISFDGEMIDEKTSLRESGLSEEEISSRLKEKRAKIETTQNARQEVWLDVFPTFLYLPWDFERKFAYVGKAKAGGKIYNILEFVQTDKEKAEALQSDSFARTRLFFDEKTHLLRHAVGELTTKKGKIKSKYFFSDYQEMDGLLIAKKINIEAVVTMKDGSKQRTIQKIEVKDFKINPVFAEGTFEVKE